MKKYLASLLSLILALTLVFTLVGCGSDESKDKDEEEKKTSQSEKEDRDEDKEKEDKDEDEEKESVVGDWVAEVDISDMLVEKLSDSEDLEGMFEYVEISEVNLVFNLTLKKNGTAILEFDEDCKDDIVDTLMDDLFNGAVKMLEEMCEEQGTTLDELLEEREMTLDDLKEEMLKNVNVDSIPGFDKFSELEFEEDCEYEFDGETLIIDGEEMDYDGDTIEIEYDGLEMVFERA